MGLVHRVELLHDVPQRRAAITTRGPDRVRDDQRGLRKSAHGRWQQHLDDVHREQLAVLGGQHLGLGERVVGRVAAAHRRGHHVERVQGSVGCRGEVEMLAVLTQLRQLGQPRERPRGVEDHRGNASPHRLVRQQPEQHALACTEPADDRHQPRRLPHLGRVVGVEHDRPPGRPDRVADVRPAPVAEPARCRGDTRGDVQSRQPPAVRRSGDRLARDELAEQPVLPSRVLDAHPPRPERGRHVPRPLEALLLRCARQPPAGTSHGSGQRQPPSRGSSGPRPRGPGLPGVQGPAARRGRARRSDAACRVRRAACAGWHAGLPHPTGHRAGTTTRPGTGAGRCAPATAPCPGSGASSSSSRPTDITATCRSTGLFRPRLVSWTVRPSGVAA